jgi:hypothetical protein
VVIVAQDAIVVVKRPPNSEDRGALETSSDEEEDTKKKRKGKARRRVVSDDDISVDDNFDPDTIELPPSPGDDTEGEDTASPPRKLAPKKRRLAKVSRTCEDSD